MLKVLVSLGSQHVLIVAAEDGLDEISISAATQVGELRDGKITRYSITPEEFGISRREGIGMLQVANAQESLALVRKALTYEDEACADIVALNAGAAIYAANVASSMAQGVQRAQEILRSSAALKKLEQLAQYSESL